MSTTEVGLRAEATAATYLVSLGYEIIARNWRRRSFEVDIVAKKANIIYLVEVKYRSSDDWGTGLEYISASKLKHLYLAAQYITSKRDAQVLIAAIELSGPRFTITNFIESISD